MMHFRAQRKSSQDVSLSESIETSADGAALSLMEVVADDRDLLEELSRQESIQQVSRAVRERLTPQEQLVIRERYGLDGSPPKRQREVAQITGISRSYVSRIEKKALQKLREAMTE